MESTFVIARKPKCHQTSRPENLDRTARQEAPSADPAPSTSDLPLPQERALAEAHEPEIVLI